MLSYTASGRAEVLRKEKRRLFWVDMLVILFAVAATSSKQPLRIRLLRGCPFGSISGKDILQ